METKPGYQTTEALAVVAALLVTVIPVVTDMLPPDSKWVAILGALLTLATYIAGRSHVKASASKAAALASAVGASQVPPSSPPQP